MIGTDGCPGELDRLRAGMCWALVRAFEGYRATDEHLHTGAWFLERHVGIDVGLGDFTIARDAHQGPFSVILARGILHCEADGGLIARDEWGRLHLTARRLSPAGSLAEVWLTIRPATAMLAHHLGGRSSRELGQFVAVVQELVDRRSLAQPHPHDIQRPAVHVLEHRVVLALAGGQEARNSSTSRKHRYWSSSGLQERCSASARSASKPHGAQRPSPRQSRRGKESLIPCSRAPQIKYDDPFHRHFVARNFPQWSDIPYGEERPAQSADAPEGGGWRTVDRSRSYDTVAWWDEVGAPLLDEALATGGFWTEVLDPDRVASARLDAPDELALLHLLPAALGLPDAP